MGEPDNVPQSGADMVIERGATYAHTQHGLVEVTAIWKGVHAVDSSRNANEKDTYIVRYSTEENGERIDELTDTLWEFVHSVDQPE